MPKAPKKSAREPKLRLYYSIHPWECRHHKDRSEIVAYVEASGKWEIIAVVNPTSGASAESLAAYIAAMVNQQQQKHDLLLAAMNALELVIDEGMNFSSEHAAEHAIDNIRKIISYPS